MRSISKRFPGVVAFDSIDLKVYPGEIIALAGENGAGKSTLMNVLGGVLEPDSGSLQIDGDEIVIKSVSDAISRGQKGLGGQACKMQFTLYLATAKSRLDALTPMIPTLTTLITI